MDNITIENEDVVNKFLDFWRASSHQRVGYLIGRYEPFADVPLGTKAVVTAIYEPPQTSSEQSVRFEEADPHEEAVDKLCAFLGMRRVGWIFTDLWAADSKAGTVHCTRHKDSFLLSAQECITAGAFQTRYRNRTRYCSDAFFGSKFVTLVASGDESQHINFSGYQVSNQCAALVEADILCPTSHPEFAWVRQHPLHAKHYITDVQFTVSAPARPPTMCGCRRRTSTAPRCGATAGRCPSSTCWWTCRPACPRSPAPPSTSAPRPRPSPWPTAR